MLGLCLIADPRLIYGVVSILPPGLLQLRVVLLDQVNLSRTESWAVHAPGG